MSFYNGVCNKNLAIANCKLLIPKKMAAPQKTVRHSEMLELVFGKRLLHLLDLVSKQWPNFPKKNIAYEMNIT